MLLQKVKTSLRISHNKLDDELTDLINAALSELNIVGITNTNELDPLIIRAVITYCKANFGMNNADSEKLQKAFELLRSHLSLVGDYNGVQ